MKLDSFCEVSLPVGPPHSRRSFSTPAVLVAGGCMYRIGLQLDKGFDGEGSARPRGRRLDVASWKRRHGCGEARVAAPDTQPTTEKKQCRHRFLYYLNADPILSYKPIRNKYLRGGGLGLWPALIKISGP